MSRWCFPFLALVLCVLPLPAARAAGPPGLATTLTQVRSLTGEYLELLDLEDPDVVHMGDIAVELAGYQLTSWTAIHRADKGEITLSPEDFRTHLHILALCSSVTGGLAWTWFGDTPAAKTMQRQGKWNATTHLGMDEVGQLLTEAGYLLFLDGLTAAAR